MKGVVFTEFLDFVELRHGYETVDAMLEMAAPASGGVYTAVGNYDFAEMSALVGALSHVTDTPAPDLLQSFGRHLFGRFVILYPAFISNFHDPLDLLEAVEGCIHVEVSKLYPDAELPRINTTRLGEDALAMSYKSCRPLGHLCLGLIQGCGRHFKTDLHVQSAPGSEGMNIMIRRLRMELPRAEARL
jgi:hypothetical protein